MNACLKTGFFGSGDFAEKCLRLISQKAKPEWVVTNAPKPAGRGMKERPTPVQTAAEALGIPFYTTEKISKDEERLTWIKENLPDLMLVIDFGHMIREPLLTMAPLGCFNIHPSLLPAYRGSAPVQRAIFDGLEKTGVTIFQLDAGMDSGPILAQREIVIASSDNSGTLLEKCAKAGCDLLLKYIYEISPEAWQLTPQPDTGFSIATKIDKSEAEINWNDSSRHIFNKIRAMNPAPIAFTSVRGKRLKILAASPVTGSGNPGMLAGEEKGFPLMGCGDGLLKLERVQPEGKSAQSAADWLRGARLKRGDSIF